ncbi:hypothetical protein B0J14DRAFT_648647 [Halenospora varia]|nr:hypothetical protein B0J14DRAFT_648647 [Halenospora varia]
MNFNSNAIATAQRADDLWQEALDSLRDELRSILILDSSQQHDRRAILEIVLFEATQKRKQCLAKRWKITKRNGDVIILRDVFEKIIKCVNQFKAVGDAAVNAASSYAASLPWGVVCMLIKGSISDNENFAAMIEGLERVTNAITRYAIFEDIYSRQRTSASDQLKTSLVSLYASILTFLANCHRYFGLNTAKRMFKTALGQLSLTDIEDDLNKIEKRQVEVDRMAQLVGMEVLQNTSTGIGTLNSSTGRMASQLELLSSSLVGLSQGQIMIQDTATMKQAIASILGPTQRLLEGLNRYDDYLTTQSRKDIFDWLSPVRYRVHHLTQKQDRLPDSGQWMFQSSEFRSWQDSSISETLWLHGMPGCGKSKLASAVIDGELQRQTDNNTIQPELAPIAYFYCSRNQAEPERSDPQEILRCIARQLCGDNPDRNINESLRHAFEKMEKPRPGENKLLLKQTVSLILRVLQDNPGTIIIDALDECDPSCRYQLFESLDTVVKESANVVKVFLTSRNDGDIVCRLNTTPNIYIDAQKNKSDIQRFIASEMQKSVTQKRMLNGNVSRALQTQISTTLDQGAQGMFRWVSLQIQNLCDPRRMKIEEDILYELVHLPKSLPDLYSIAFDQMIALGRSSYRVALSSLQLLLVAVRPVTWDEFLHLLSCSKMVLNRESTKSEILDITSNFLEDDKVANRPKFVHLSAKEYLETRQEFLPEISNMTAAIACFDSLRVTLPEQYTYSTLYFGPHLASTTKKQRLAYPGMLQEFLISKPVPLSDELKEFQISGYHWKTGTWELPELFAVWRERIRRLHENGYLSTDRADSAEMCTTSLVSTNPLLAMSALGLEEMLSELPSPDFASKFDLFLPKLSWIGQEAMNQYKDRTCMELAVIYNRPRVLYAYHSLRQNLNIYTYEQETLLHLASKLGRVWVIDILLSCGVDPNLLSGQHKAPMPIHDNFIPSQPITPSLRPETFIADTESSGMRRPQTAMGFRTYYGGKSGVYSPFYLNQENKAAIHLATERENYMAVVQVLIKHGANVNIRTSNKITTLQLALEAKKSKNEMFSILLEAGADPNARLDQQQTVLHLVAAMGSDETVKILLAGGADQTIKDAFGQTPGQLALRYGHRSTAKLLGVVEVPQIPRKPVGSNLRPPQAGHTRRVKSDGNVQFVGPNGSYPDNIPQIQVDDMTSKVQQKRPQINPFRRGLVKSEWSKLRMGFSS